MWRDPGEEAALDDEAREIVAAIARDNIGYQPTTQVIVGLLDMFDDDYLARPGVADAYPRALLDLPPKGKDETQSPGAKPGWRSTTATRSCGCAGGSRRRRTPDDQAHLLHRHHA
jgi:hypothetical protein